MSESVFDKINKLSNERKPRELKRLEEWQKKLIIEYYPAVDYEELMEFFDAPKSTISGIARRSGVQRFRGKADKEKYLKKRKPLRVRAKELEMAYQDKLDAIQEKEEQERIAKELQDEKKRQARLKKIGKIVDGYDDEALRLLAEAITKEQVKEYRKLLEEKGSSDLNEEIEIVEDWFVNSSFCLLDGNYIIEECRRVVSLADKERA